MDLDVLQPAQPPSPALVRTPTAPRIAVPGSRIITVPSTRQKSCDACVAGKRGCNKLKPTCSRCAARKIPCVYRRRESHSKGSAVASNPDRATASPAASAASIIVPEVIMASSNSSSSNDHSSTILQQQADDALGIPDEPKDESMLPLQLHHQLSSNLGDSLFGPVVDINLDDFDPNTSLSLLSSLSSLSSSSALESSVSCGISGNELSLFTSGNSPSSFHSSTSPQSSSSSSASSSASGSPPNPTLPFQNDDLCLDDSMIDYSLIDIMPGLDSITPIQSDAWFNHCTDFPDLPALEIRQSFMIPDSMPAVAAPPTTVYQKSACKPWDAQDPQSSIGTVLTLIKTMPETFARTRSTPFFSSEIYRTRQPRAITHAWTACTVYAARTPATAAWASRVVIEGAAALMRSPPLPLDEDSKAFTSAGKVDTVALLDRLACVHALCMYQIIRGFDGDIMMSSHAQNDWDVLIKWALELFKIRDKLEDEGFGGTVIVTMSGQTIAQKAPASWDDWMLMESTRRTSMMAVCIIAAFYCIHNRSPPICLFNERNTFTLSRHLWTADSAANFYYAWRNKPQLCISKLKFDSVLKFLSPDDVCDFGLAFLKLKLGAEVVDKFMLSISTGMELY